MKGQWLGTYSNTNDDFESDDGRLMVNIDELEACYRGVVCIIPNNKKESPLATGYFITSDKAFEQTIEIFVRPINPNNYAECKWESIKHLYSKSLVLSEKIYAKVLFKDNKLTIVAKTDIGLAYNTTLTQPNHTDESRVSGRPMSWEEFKTHVSRLEKNTYIFRGQQEPWKLQTSFHRRNRYCIDDFINFDVKNLHQRLSSLTSHYFDLSVAEQNGAFFNLLQHHGYPTPLLDWSHSPYVSAFFAFRDWPINYDGEVSVRLYIFNSLKWHKLYNQTNLLNPPFPHLSVMEFVSINNPRLVPQQAITTATNIDDIEHYLLECSKTKNIDFIQAVDIPASEREKAMQDLRYMGITAGSMFPDIDGACEEFRERHFKN